VLNNLLQTDFKLEKIFINPTNFILNDNTSSFNLFDVEKNLSNSFFDSKNSKVFF